ncbi:hypothetical protein CEXT_409761 [Caerostris extrusa]|uniref:Ycf15 n=1 Tax=Caerostris extrusa TaxID=172846 RepID=A0AAV4SYT6_CAEEX|nr:hypothetical protein CEXT_409761 [Caerostris extrusa]
MVLLHIHISIPNLEQQQQQKINKKFWRDSLAPRLLLKPNGRTFQPSDSPSSVEIRRFLFIVCGWKPRLISSDDQCNIHQT